MKAWLGQRWAAIWRLIGGVSLRVKIIGLTLAMMALLSLGLVWQVGATMARVGIPSRGLNDTLSDVTHQILLTTLLVFLMAITITTALTWVLIRPVLSLARALGRVAQGDLSQRLIP